MILPSSDEYTAMSPEEKLAYLYSIGDTSPNGTGYSSPTEVNTDLDLSTLSGPLGFAVGASPLGSIPGISSMTSASLSGATPEQMGSVLGKTAVGTGIGRAIGALLPGVPIVGNVAASLGAETINKEPNFKAAGISSSVPSLAAMFGSVMGPLGSILLGSLTSYFTNKSLKDGTFGDWADSRSKETEKDAVEDAFGVGTEETKAMEARDDFMQGIDSVSEYGFGLNKSFDATTAGQLQKSAGDPFSSKKDLMDYFSQQEIDDVAMPSVDVSGKRSPHELDYTDADMSKLGFEAIATDHSVKSPGNLGNTDERGSQTLSDYMDRDKDPGDTETGSGFGDRESEPGGMGGV